MTEQTKTKVKRIGKLTAVAFFILLFTYGCPRVLDYRNCNPVQQDSFEWGSRVCSRQYEEEYTFAGLKKKLKPSMYTAGIKWYDVEVTKTLNADGSYTVVVTGFRQSDDVKRRFTFSNVRPSESCPDLVPNEERTTVDCAKPKETSALQQQAEAKKMAMMQSMFNVQGM